MIRKEYFQEMRRFMLEGVEAFTESGIRAPFVGINDQEHIFVKSYGAQFPFIYGIINQPTEENIITGPCFIPSSEIGRFRSCDAETAESILAKSPTIQNVVCVGLPKNGRGVIVLETKEYANLNPNRPESAMLEAARRTLNFILAYQHTIAGNNSGLPGFKPLYTHEAAADEMVRDTIRELLSEHPEIRGHKALSKCDNPEEHGRLRIEASYTPQFAERLFGKGCSYTVAENYKHGLQFFDEFGILKSVFSRAIKEGRLNFLGLIPPKSLDGKVEMDNGKPIYLGSRICLQGSLDELDKPITSSRTTRLTDLLIVLGEAELALDLIDLTYVRQTSKRIKSGVDCTHIVDGTDSALDKIREKALDKVREKLEAITGHTLEVDRQVSTELPTLKGAWVGDL